MTASDRLIHVADILRGTAGVDRADVGWGLTGEVLLLRCHRHGPPAWLAGSPEKIEVPEIGLMRFRKPAYIVDMWATTQRLAVVRQYVSVKDRRPKFDLLALSYFEDRPDGRDPEERLVALNGWVKRAGAEIVAPLTIRIRKIREIGGSEPDRAEVEYYVTGAYKQRARSGSAETANSGPPAFLTL